MGGIRAARLAGAGGTVTKEASPARPAGECLLTGTVLISRFEKSPLSRPDPQPLRVFSLPAGLRKYLKVWTGQTPPGTCAQGVLWT